MNSFGLKCHCQKCQSFSNEKKYRIKLFFSLRKNINITLMFVYFQNPYFNEILTCKFVIMLFFPLTFKCLYFRFVFELKFVSNFLFFQEIMDTFHQNNDR
uniref:Uncharacterized protein n=1 Tax=Cacopsylla melanoneura TaxID=428564 RepID=A0A8D8VUZ1_9HEMI